MKKALLVTLLATMLICVFALCVSATGFESSFTSEVTKYYAEDGQTELTPDWADLSDKNATAVLKKADETYIRIPLYYIYQTNKSTELRHEIRTSKGSAGFRYDWIKEQLGEEFTHDNLVALDIPEGIIKTSGLNNYKALKEVVFPLTATSFPKSEKHPALEKVFAKQKMEANGTITGITSVSDYAFKSVATLQYFKLELDYATYVGANAFLGCAVKELRFEGPFTGIGGSPFGSCKQLETVYINNTSGNIYVCDQGFKGSSALKSVKTNGISFNNYTFENVNALTNGGLELVATNTGDVGYMAFKNATNFSSITLTGVTSIGGSAFLNCTNLKSIDISGPITSIDNNIFSGSKNIESAIIRVIGNTFSDQTSVGGVNSIVSKANYEGDKDAYATGNHIIYGYTVCDLTYNGVHLEDNNPCVINCTRCGTTGVAEENPVHKEASVIEYASYDKVGTITTTCQNEGCKHKAVTEAPALFEAIGYSVPEDIDKGGIVIGYIVNHSAVAEYEKNTGKTVNYGVYAVAQKNLGENDIFDENGNVADGVVDAKVEKNAYVSFEFKIVGFNDDTKDSKLAMGAYVAVTKGETTEYSYIQLGTPAEGAKYAFTSYAEYLKSFS